MWRDRHFQEIGDVQEQITTQKTDTDQPVLIPGIDDADINREISRASHIRREDDRQIKRSRFDLNLTRDVGSMTSMESEMGMEMEDTMDASWMRPQRQPPMQRPRSKFASSIRIPRQQNPSWD